MIKRLESNFPKAHLYPHCFGGINRKIFLQINRANDTCSKNLHLNDYQRGPVRSVDTEFRHSTRCTYSNEE
jgi:hypothetical protein